MKIALCLSGHMRTYEETFNSLEKYLISELNPDIFIHTWEDNITDWNKVKNIFKSIEIIIEKPKNIINNYLLDKTNKNISVVNMFYKIYECNKLKIKYENKINKNYDLVIRARPDNILFNPLNKIEIEDNNNLYVPIIGHNVWIDDTFAFSSSQNMNYYSNTFLYLEEFAKEFPSFHPETLLKLNCEKYNLIVKQSKNKIGLLRENGIIDTH